MEFATLIELAKYTTPPVIVALGLGYWLYKSSDRSAERANDRSVALEDILTNHLDHVEKAVDRQTEGLAEHTTVLHATCRVLERAVDKI